MAYVEKYNAQWLDVGVQHEIKLLLKDGGGGSTPITIVQKGLVYERSIRGSKDMPLKNQITGSEIRFNFVSTSADIDEYDAIFDSEYKDWKVEHYYNSVLDFVGWLQPDNYTRPEIKRGDLYFLSLSAVDGLANLKKVEFVNASTGDQYDDRVSIMTQIKRALAHVGHELNFKVQLGIWCTNVGGSMTSTDCALDKATCDSRRFIKTKEGRVVNTNCYKVISQLLKPFNCYLIQSNGEYWIINTREYDSYVFSILWNSITTITSRTVSDLTLDIFGMEYHRTLGERQRIRPIETVEVSYRDRNVGDSLLSNGDFSTPSTSEWNNGGDLHVFDTLAFEDNYELRAKIDIGAAGVPSDTPSFYSNAEAITILGDEDTLVVTYKLRCTEVTMDASGIPDYYHKTKIKVQVRKGSPTGTIINAAASLPVTIGEIDSGYTIYTSTFYLVDTDDYYVEFLIDKVTDLLWSEYSIIEVRFDDISFVTKFSTGDDITFDRHLKVTNTDSDYIDTEPIELNFGDSNSDSDIAALKIGGVRTETWERADKTENVSINVLAAQNIIENYSKYKDYLRLVIIDNTDRLLTHSIIEINGTFYQIVEQTAKYQVGQFKELTVALNEIIISDVGTSIKEEGLNTVDGKEDSSGSEFVENPNPVVPPGITDHQALTVASREAPGAHEQYESFERGLTRSGNTVKLGDANIIEDITLSITDDSTLLIEVTHNDGSNDFYTYISEAYNILSLFVSKDSFFNGFQIEENSITIITADGSNQAVIAIDTGDVKFKSDGVDSKFNGAKYLVDNSSRWGVINSSNLYIPHIGWIVDNFGGGNVTKVGTPVNNQIGIWTGDGTIEGDVDLTFDGAEFVVGVNIDIQGATVKLSGIGTDFSSNHRIVVINTIDASLDYAAIGIDVILGWGNLTTKSLTVGNITLDNIKTGSNELVYIDLNGKFAVLTIGTGLSLDTATLKATLNLQEVTDEGSTTDKNMTIENSFNGTLTFKIKNVNTGTGARPILELQNNIDSAYIYKPNSNYTTAALQNKFVFHSGDDWIWWDGSVIKMSLNATSGILNVSGNLQENGTDLEDKYQPIQTTVKAVLEIGDWNMDGTSSVSFAHGLTFSEIRGVPNVMIRNNANTGKYPLNRVAIGASAVAGGVVEINSSNIQIGRATSGFFDDPDFNSTSYNRGWVTIEYIP